tara:strand:- start:532 stop:801 length:270 start_codon:yes stop_codon:yes gene_type:complete
MLHSEFVNRFRVLFSSIDMTPSATGTKQQFENEARAALTLLIPQFPNEPVAVTNPSGFEFEMEVGMSKVFYRAPTHRKIEKKRRVRFKN